MRRLEISLTLFFLLFVIAAFGSPAHAGGVVTNCANDSDIAAKLAGGGSVTFSCGVATITLNNTQEITTDTIIDGGGKITLSGGDAVKLFSVHSGTALQLHNIVLTGGASTSGGAITNNGSLYLDRVTIQQSSGPEGGGGIYNNGVLQVAGSTFTGNSSRLGGAIFNNNGQYLSVQNSTFSLNTVESGGGAITNRGIANVLATTFAHNTSGYEGGAINNQNSGYLSIDRTTFISNTAIFGGAIENFVATLVVTSSTLSDNYASDDGGGMENLGANVSLWNVTFVGNSSVYAGGGIYSNLTQGGTFTAKNVLLASNPAGGNCQILPATMTPGFNLSSDNTCNFGAGRDNVDPMLDPLSYNGGSTKSYMPKPGSPAIDGGDTTGCASVDQRGVALFKGTACEVGSVEICADKPFKPVLVALNKHRVKTTQVPLVWTYGYCATDYKVVVRKGSLTGPKVFRKKVDGDTVTTKPLAHGETYYVRVSGCNTHGCAASDAFKFKVK